MGSARRWFTFPHRSIELAGDFEPSKHPGVRDQATEVDVFQGQEIDAAMSRALDLARAPQLRFGANPRVGCVLLDDDLRVVGEGAHLGAGTPHAEVAALAVAGSAAAGTTAVVTLEPCRHHGRTGPCTQALIDAGVRRVIFAASDPNPEAAGGAAELRAAGIEVIAGLRAEESTRLNRVWTTSMRLQRPFVTWKYAATLDGRTAAVDGSSKWITSAAARADTHLLRAAADVILVGTGTVEADDPALTARAASGEELADQPLRAVMGLRDLDPGLRVFDGRAETHHFRTRDPAAVLAQLWEQQHRHVFIEGGAQVAAAFLRAGLVDEVVGYFAPALLGSGTSLVGDLGITSITGAMRFQINDVRTVGVGADMNVRVVIGPVTEPRGEAEEERN